MSDTSDTFFDRFLVALPAAFRVLDVGAGDGRYSAAIAPYASEVVAIEPVRVMRPMPPNVAVHQGCTFEEWYAQVGRGREKFDGVFVKNVLQFMPRKHALETVIPKLKACVAPGGVLHIETFFREPSPMFEDGFHDGLFSHHDFVHAIGSEHWPDPMWELRRETRCDVDGMDTTERECYFVRIFARREA